VALRPAIRPDQRCEKVFGASQPTPSPRVAPRGGGSNPVPEVQLRPSSTRFALAAEVGERTLERGDALLQSGDAFVEA
jgi:hypothetical protein